MNRRTFLGLLGSSVVAAATVDVFEVGRSILAGRTVIGKRHVYDIMFTSNETGIYNVCRWNSEEPVIRLGVAKGGILRWVAVPDHEIVTAEGEPMLALEGPGIGDWSMCFRDDGGGDWCAAFNDGQESLVSFLDMATQTDAEMQDNPYEWSQS